MVVRIRLGEQEEYFNTSGPPLNDGEPHLVQVRIFFP